MRILIISGTYPPDKCGVGDYTANLYKNFRNSENFDIILMHSHGIISAKETRNVHLSWGVTSIFKNLRLINSIKPDIVHLEFPTQSYRKSIGIVLLFMLLRFKYKLVLTLHEYSYSPLLAKIRTYPLVKLAHRIIVVDPLYESDLKRITKAKKVSYVPIAANINRNTLSDSEKALKRMEYTKDKELLLGYFGFVNKTKGIEVLIDLAKRLKLQGKLFKMMLICSLDSNDKYHKELLDKMEDVKEHFIITGYKDEEMVANLISICDCMIFPFIHGVSPKNGSLIASMMQNVPIITTKPKIVSSFFENVYLVSDMMEIENYLNTCLPKRVEYPTLDFVDVANRHTKIYGDIKWRK